jgi:hypothetical protein
MEMKNSSQKSDKGSRFEKNDIEDSMPFDHIMEIDIVDS